MPWLRWRIPITISTRFVFKQIKRNFCRVLFFFSFSDTTTTNRWSYLPNTFTPKHSKTHHSRTYYSRTHHSRTTRRQLPMPMLPMCKFPKNVKYWLNLSTFTPLYRSGGRASLALTPAHAPTTTSSSNNQDHGKRRISICKIRWR